MIRFLLALCTAGLLSAAASAQSPAPPSDLDAFVTNVLRQFEVPGISVAVVKDGKVVWAKGYGLRTLGRPGKVDSHTLFGIASNTKAFTATAIGLLVEEGKVEWDAPVTRYLPWFRLSDPYVTRELTVLDLLVHRSGLGLGAGDLLWWPASTYDRREIARRLGAIPLARSFRSAYAYDNVLYTVAGELIEAVSGQSWEEFVSSRILAKVGMNESNVRHSDAAKGSNAAIPHARVEGTLKPVKPFQSDNVNPAGGINSSAADMAKWLIVQLDSGRVAEGGRLFSPQTTRRLWALVTPVPIGAGPGRNSPLAALQPNFSGYALGFDVRDYRGRKMVSHTGGLPGYVSMVTMIPEIKLGIVVLTNQESGEAFSAITYHLLDHYLGAPPIDWLAAYAARASRRDSSVGATDRASAAARDSLSHPSLPLARYTGTYADAWYGDMTIAEEGGKLVMRFGHTPDLAGILEHWQYDTFLVRWWNRELLADALVTFSLTYEGKIDQVKMKALSPATDFSFDFQDLLFKPVPPASKR